MMKCYNSIDQGHWVFNFFGRIHAVDGDGGWV